MDDVLIGETGDIIEILLCILGVTARVRVAKHRDSTARPVKIAQGIRRKRRLGERADKDDVDMFRQYIEEVFETGVGYVGDGMSFFFTPHSNNLRHDAREIGVHDPCPYCPGRSPGDEVYYSNPKSAHTIQSFHSPALASGFREIKREPLPGSRLFHHLPDAIQKNISCYVKITKIPFKREIALRDEKGISP